MSKDLYTLIHAHIPSDQLRVRYDFQYEIELNLHTNKVKDRDIMTLDKSSNSFTIEYGKDGVKEGRMEFDMIRDRKGLIKGMLASVKIKREDGTKSIGVLCRVYKK